MDFWHNRKDGTFYLPSEFTEFFLNGKKQGHVIVTKGVSWFETSTEAVLLYYLLILSIQEFNKLQNTIETGDFTTPQKNSLFRTIIAPARKRLLRNNGRITVKIALRGFTNLSGDVLITMKANKIQVLPKEIDREQIQIASAPLHASLKIS